MKTREQILEAVRAGRESACLDHRDYARLTDFFPAEDWPVFGFTVKEGAAPSPPCVLDEAAVKERLKADVAFGFEKALDQRGISASLMYGVVKMWLWVLDDPLENLDDYAPYGLPLFRAVALKYGFETPDGVAP